MAGVSDQEVARRECRAAGELIGSVRAREVANAQVAADDVAPARVVEYADAEIADALQVRHQGAGTGEVVGAVCASPVRQVELVDRARTPAERVDAPPRHADVVYVRLKKILALAQGRSPGGVGRIDVQCAEQGTRGAQIGDRERHPIRRLHPDDVARGGQLPGPPTVDRRPAPARTEPGDRRGLNSRRAEKAQHTEQRREEPRARTPACGDRIETGGARNLETHVDLSRRLGQRTNRSTGTHRKCSRPLTICGPDPLLTFKKTPVTKNRTRALFCTAGAGTARNRLSLGPRRAGRRRGAHDRGSALPLRNRKSQLGWPSAIVVLRRRPQWKASLAAKSRRQT